MDLGQARAERLLIDCVCDPAQLETLGPPDLALVIDAARTARLLGWLMARLDERGLPQRSTAWLDDRLASARALCAQLDASLHWEINRLRRAFLGQGIDWVLLKGAGYAAIDLAPGRGRRVADIDLLVAKSNLSRVETLLSAHGWQSRDISEYDDAYYRQWMHELPPLHHAERHSTVDLHHAVLPTTSRLKPSSERLLAQAVPIGSAGDRVLSPPHMVLHGAAHLFHDGEIAGALRDLVDLDSLLRTFGAQPRFWDDFVREAQELDLTRPAFYAVRYAQRWFRTPVPAPVWQTIETWGPPAPVRVAMDQLVSRTLPDATRSPSRAAVFSLYVRSHWLRMPPLMLARHLTRKAVVRVFGDEHK